MSDHLDYENHLEDYKRRNGFYEEEKEDILLKIEEDALHSHALAVFGPLRENFLKAIRISDSLNNEEAKYYMLYGAGRRLKMIYNAYRKVNFIAYEARTEPLSSDTQSELNGAINSIYTHLHGVLDNFVWCILYEKDPKVIDKLSKYEVKLFSKAALNKSVVLTDLKRYLLPFYDWYDDVSSRRDPVAHRIPLYVPPSVVSEKEASEYEEQFNKYKNSVKNLDLEKAQRALENVGMLGKFSPYFVRHPNEPYMAIYPTIPADMVNLIRVTDVIEEALLG